MERSKVLLIGGGSILAIAVAVYLMQRRDAAIAVASESTETPAQEVKSAGTSGFNSNIAVNVNSNAFNSLTNRFMPLFGLVGIGVVNTQPSIGNVNVEYQVTNLTAPPVPGYMIPGLPQTQPQSLMDGWRAARGIR